MEQRPTESAEQNVSEFSRQAEKAQRGFLRELSSFLRREKNWWLTPILLALALAVAFTVFGGSSIAPFIYAVF